MRWVGDFWKYFSGLNNQHVFVQMNYRAVIIVYVAIALFTA